MMVITLKDALGAELAARLCALLDGGEAVATREAAAAVLDSLGSHPLLLLGVQPRRLSQPVFQYYGEGMESSATVGNAVAGEDGGIRADVGVTVFLSDPSSYEGGSLFIDTGYGDESYRECAGGCVAWPASARYGVARVTRGHRWTAELWIQSFVRAPAQREVLYDIGCSLHLLELFGGGRNADVDRLHKCQQNLLRLWSDL